MKMVDPSAFYALEGDFMAVLLLVLCLASVFGSFGLWISQQKGRSPHEGAALGFFLGPLGTLIEVLLPTIEGSNNHQSGKSG
jgi:hypothetical protein